MQNTLIVLGLKDMLISYTDNEIDIGDSVRRYLREHRIDEGEVHSVLVIHVPSEAIEVRDIDLRNIF